MGYFHELQWKDTEKTYQAFVPSKLADKDLKVLDWSQKFKSLDQRIVQTQDNVIPENSNIFDRYLAGGSVLKEHRYVSHKRIYLNQALPISSDIDAELIDIHMKGYRTGIDIGTKDDIFTTETLCAMHATIKNNQDNSGKVRTGQGWIGGDSPLDAYYICPPAFMLESLLEDLCLFINRRDIPVSLKAAVAHIQLCVLHPFSDGNGRLARMLVETIYRRENLVTKLSPPSLLVRLTDTKLDYIATIKAFELDDVSKLYHFWLESTDWGLEQIANISTASGLYINNCIKRVPLIYRTETLVRTLKLLIRQPIIYPSYLAESLAISPKLAKETMLILSQYQILCGHKLRQPQDFNIWDSGEALAIHQELDALFLNSN